MIASWLALVSPRGSELRGRRVSTPTIYSRSENMNRKLAPSRKDETFCIGPVCNTSSDTVKNVVTVVVVVLGIAAISNLLKK